MATKFNIGINRNVIVENQDNELVVVIEEAGTDKSAVFTGKRWTEFTRLISDINNAVAQLKAGQSVSYQEHIGEKWFVCISKGYFCINLRQFYEHQTKELRPTRRGIALRLLEWTRLVAVIPEVTRILQSEGI
jgi:hypothetical protein